MGSPQNKGPLKTFSQFVNLCSYSPTVYMDSLRINGNPSGYYMSNLPRTLRTPLISPYSPTLPYTPNRVKHFEPLGLSCKLKEIDFNALQCVGR